MSSTKMGPFELEGVIGRGGMGTVYRARHEDTQEVVAIKALSETYSHDQQFRSRFESEIKALIQLDHPNIVRLISHGQEDGNLYFAMELVEGKSLFQLQKQQGPLHWREVLKLARSVATGLRHAHDRGIIHRDLKPGNLLKSDDDVYKITDFGIAKRFGTSQNTEDNVVGTLAFMSPEQAKGQPVTVRSDLFSLGIVLYTMLGGRPPFTGNSMEESLRNLTTVPAPSLSTIVSELPEEIDNLISSLIEKNPEERVPTTQVLLHRISKIENQLKSYSQAATAHGRPEESDSPKTMSSFKTSTGPVKDEGSKSSQPKTAASKNLKAGATVQGSLTKVIASSDVTASKTKVESNRGEAVEKPDYYNRVTDEERRRSLQSETSEPESRGLGVIGLSLGLLAVLGLAAFGIYSALRPMTADELYEAIVVKTERPHKVKVEIKEFVERFPDDERVEQIRRLEKVATAITYFNTKSMAFANKGESRLTTMEQEFVKTINLAKDDSVSGYSRLRAFITFHEANVDEEERAVACLNAAKGYLTKLRIDADNFVDWHQKSIASAFERAEGASIGEKVKIFEAIIELYQDTKWAKESVANASERLKLLTK